MQLSTHDMVMIRTTRNITWLSAPPSSKPDPKGVWSVLAFSEDNKTILITKKNGIIVRVPVRDVKVVGKYDVNKVIGDVKKVRTLADLQGEKNGKKG